MHSINEVYDTKYKGKQAGVIRSANKSGYSKYFFEIQSYVIMSIIYITKKNYKENKCIWIKNLENY